MQRIRTKKSWLNHMPKRPHRLEKSYYSHYENKDHQKIVRIILALLVIFLLQGILQAKYFKLNNFIITGNKDLATDEIQTLVNNELNSKRWLVFKNSNYFLVKTEKLATSLLTKYNLETVKVKKKFPHSLEINIQEKISNFIWQRNDALYLLDAKGFLNRQIEALDEKYLVIEDQRSQVPTGDQVFNEQEIKVINGLFLDWNRLIGVKPALKKIVLTDNDSLIQLYTEPGFYVKVNPKEDIVKQLTSLKQVLMSQNIVNGGDIDYIDARFENRVYFQ